MVRSGRIAGLLVLVVVAGCGLRPAGLDVARLRTEYAAAPLGLDTRAPRLAWQIRSDTRGTVQAAYQIRAARTAAQLASGRNLLWDTGKVASAQSIQHAYAGPALASRERIYWQVRVWDQSGRTSRWSEPAFWEMGLLEPRDWTASWIESGLRQDPAESGAPPLLRREFSLTAPVRSARAYVTAHGLYKLYLNGQTVGDAELTPGWTTYHKRLQYQVYDITALLRPGENAIGAMLGNGWYRGVFGFDPRPNFYGDRLGLLLQIEVEYEDGRRATIATDEGWRSSTGAVVMSEIYLGETYDARLEQGGWTLPGFDDESWQPVQPHAGPKDILVASVAPPVRKIEELRAKRILTTPAGETVFDFGQNLVGWVRLTAAGPAGTTVTLRHAEVLDQAGNFYTDNLRTASQVVQYTMKGQGREVYEPHFTFQGFRYVAVSGYPGDPPLDSVVAVVLHTDMEKTGGFECSNALVNQLQSNVLWGQKGNFVDVPTDCPQRDERMGWTGDAQAFSATAAFNMDVAAFFTKWLADLAADQLEDGRIPFVSPNILVRPDGSTGAGAAGWGDAATIIPWNLYLAYGDTRILERQYTSMAKWVAYQRARAGDDLIWSGDFQFGDWLDYFATQKNQRMGSTSTDLIATAFFARSTQILRDSARVLGKAEDEARYASQWDDITRAFRAAFVRADGQVGEGTQTAYVLALDFNLLDAAQRPLAAARLAEEVRMRGHLTTGFLGTPRLLHSLSDAGYVAEAYALLNREEFPAWLYPVRQGATTIWERWDGIKPDGSFQDKSMNSFNHYAYGAVGEWLYTAMAGIRIDPAAPGYRHVLIEPLPGGGFTHASASHSSPYGRVASSWRMAGGTFTLEIEVPPNATARVRLPDARADTVQEAGEPIRAGNGILSTTQEPRATVVAVGSGNYTFSYPLPPP